MRKLDSTVPLAYWAEPPLLLQRASQALRDAIRDTPAQERFGALLMGPTGDGKSSVAAWLLRRWHAHAMKTGNPAASVAWLDALEATDAERRYRLGTGTPEELDEAYTADWLVLDDVGKTAAPTVVQLILARRYAASRPTIVTTGLTPQDLSTHVGAATVRRILEFQGKPGVFSNGHARAAA